MTARALIDELALNLRLVNTQLCTLNCKPLFGHLHSTYCERSTSLLAKYDAQKAAEASKIKTPAEMESLRKKSEAALDNLVRAAEVVHAEWK